MRKREKPSLNGTQQVLLRPQQELDRVLAAMVAMSNRIGKPFSEARMDQLNTDLGGYPVEAIEWSLDSWGRNAKVLPALSDLLQLLRTWHVVSQPEQCECRHLHGTGYGLEDLKWLLKQRGLHAERWSIEKWEGLVAELDKKRPGGAPNWRGTEEGKQFLRT
jgi:hypothetical protein